MINKRRLALALVLPVMAAVSFQAELAYSQSPQAITLGSFAIDQSEVTIGRFRAFAQRTKLVTQAQQAGGGFEYSGGWQRRDGWYYAMPFGTQAHDDEPAVHVTWFEARDFCVAAGGRLPTYDEWRSAAYTEQRDSPPPGFETGRTYVYPVGDSPKGMNNSQQGHVRVGTTKPGVNGLYDMGANAWEWVADRNGDQALTAGGSWWYGPSQTRDRQAQWKAADFYVVYIGFRCAYDLNRG